MANVEHTRQLKLGVRAWNRWRKKHPEIIPDLMNADLSGLQLGGQVKTDIYKYFTKAYLRASGVRLANFGGDHGVDFKHAKLRGASLKGADLRMVDFTLADLEGANLLGGRSHRRPFLLDTTSFCKPKGRKPQRGCDCKG